MPGRKPKSWWQIGLFIITAPLWLPLFALLIACLVMSLPLPWFASMRESRRFRSEGRAVRWNEAIGEIEHGNGILLVECEPPGPARRLWWFRQPLPPDCPLPTYNVSPSADLDWFKRNDEPLQQWCDLHLLPHVAHVLLITNAPSRWHHRLRNTTAEVRIVCSCHIKRLANPPEPRGFEPRLTSPSPDEPAQ